MEHAWKVCVRLSVPRVRIPPLPPDTKLAHFTWAFLCLAEEEGLVHIDGSSRATARPATARELIPTEAGAKSCY